MKTLHYFKSLLGVWRSGRDLVGILLPKGLPQETGSEPSISSSRKGEEKEKKEAESVFSWGPGTYTKNCRVLRYQATPLPRNTSQAVPGLQPRNKTLARCVRYIG